MNIMVIGGGGREHAIIKKLRENPSVQTIWCLPGNGGIAADATCVPVGATDIEGICAFAKTHPVDFAVVTPDDPLALGAVDRLEDMGIPCFGPRQNAALIEASKAFAKDLMRRYGIPTAKYMTFDDMGEALKYVDEQGAPLVVKADGLALGKGVIICQTTDEAREAVTAMMGEEHRFGRSGARVVIEELLEGPEVSVLSFTDGETIVPMVSSMDHKRAHDGDQGPNTGGMGTIAPNPCYTSEIARRCMDEIFLPTIRAMKAEGRPFKGCLYFGLMITKDGPKVIEYNCRFGDPETQVVLPLLKTDLLTVMCAVSAGTLKDVDVVFDDGAACCVVLASGGYPGHYEKGKPIEVIDSSLLSAPGVTVYHAGDRLDGDTLVTSGGRVLGVTCRADTLPAAIAGAYTAVGGITFEGAFCRRDIGARALAR